MTVGEKIANKALAALGEPDTERRPFFCLAFVRDVIEEALDLPAYQLYALLAKGMTAQEYRRRWAVDAEMACRKLGYSVVIDRKNPLKPGDIVFSDASAPYGHVGVVVERDGRLYVVENTASKSRQRKYGQGGGALAVTPLQAWDRITTVVRLPEDFGSLGRARIA
ncbi:MULTISPECIES: CHAP domain-containing protein [unclassified Meiothermus]|uniref:CHAP domain-containing protein n=1 Tax=unclassified Meiothermus TaxID=370471 RepID=UPI001314701A|nr:MULTISPECIES: CHAP domain-containing protein [unclassified Meiothermus]